MRSPLPWLGAPRWFAHHTCTRTPYVCHHAGRAYRWLRAVGHYHPLPCPGLRSRSRCMHATPASLAALPPPLLSWALCLVGPLLSASPCPHMATSLDREHWVARVHSHHLHRCAAVPSPCCCRPLHCAIAYAALRHINALLLVVVTSPESMHALHRSHRVRLSCCASTWPCRRRLVG